MVIEDLLYSAVQGNSVYPKRTMININELRDSIKVINKKIQLDRRKLFSSATECKFGQVFSDKTLWSSFLLLLKKKKK